MSHYLPENDVHSRKALIMLKDVWWALRTKSGSIFKAPITRYGADGHPNGETTAEAEFGWNRENVAKLDHKLNLILAKLEETK